jgi:hypothetical protein
LHVGVERDFAPARKAHPAFVVDDLDALAARIGDVTWDDELPGVRRFYASDPFGNRLEFLEPTVDTEPRDVGESVSCSGRTRRSS